MSNVHPNSKRCEKSEIDLFSVPPTQLSLEKGRWIDYRPLSSVQNDDAAITFMISGTDEYLDLSKTILIVEGTVEASDGTSQVTASQAPVNNFLHSLFKQVDVYLNGKQVTPAMGTYPYRAYIETLLNYDVSAKKSQLSSALYFKDTPGHMEEGGGLPSTTVIKTNQDQASAIGKAKFSKIENVMISGTGNQGFAKRSKFISEGKKFVLSGPIFSDIFMCDRLLLNMVDLKVVLNRAPNAFCLMDVAATASQINPKVKFEDVVLKIRKVKVDETVSIANEQILKRTPALYPIRRVECKALTIPANLPHVRKDNIFSGMIPKSFVFGLVDAAAFSGIYGGDQGSSKGFKHGNPYNFQHFNVSTITLTVNGEEVPFKQLTLDYKGGNAEKNKDFVQAYNTLFSGTGKMYTNTGLDITREEYDKGYTLYVFDLTPDMCNTSGYFNAIQRGSLSVDITFGEASKVPIAMVCYGDFENIISINSERNVIYDIS